MSLLEVRNLRTSFFTDAGEVKAVNDTSSYNQISILVVHKGRLKYNASSG